MQSKQSKHTPGPWVAYHDADAGQWQVNDADEREIVATGIETEANARLMASAPEMRELIADLITSYDDDNGQVMQDAIADARALLARIDGDDRE